MAQQTKKMMAKMATKKNFIQGAIKKPGALRKSLGIKKGKTIPAKTLAKAAKNLENLGNVLDWLKRLKN